MARLRKYLGLALGFCFLATILVMAYYQWQHISGIALDASCAQKKPSEVLEKAITSLDNNIDLGIKLSTSIVGAGAALLFGLKSGISMPGWLKMCFIASLLPFIQSTFYGVWWRLEIALVWTRQCPELIEQERTVAIYQAAFLTFLQGAGAVIVLLVIIALLGTVVPSGAKDATPET